MTTTYYIKDEAEIAEVLNTFAADSWAQAVYFIGDTDRDEDDFTVIQVDSEDLHTSDRTEDWRTAVIAYRLAALADQAAEADHQRQERAQLLHA